jgi:hypothetical protein
VSHARHTLKTGHQALWWNPGRAKPNDEKGTSFPECPFLQNGPNLWRRRLDPETRYKSFAGALVVDEKREIGLRHPDATHLDRC